MTRARNVRFSIHVWRTQSDKIRSRRWKVLLRMLTSNGKIQISVAHAHFERENKTPLSACALLEKMTFRTGSWPFQIIHSMHDHEKYRVHYVREGSFDSREVCNTSRRLVFGSCCKLYTLVWDRLHLALVTQYNITLHMHAKPSFLHR